MNHADGQRNEACVTTTSLRSLLLAATLALVSLAPAHANERPSERDALTRLSLRTEQLAQLAARFLGEARREGDDAQARCLDRKLTEVHALLRQAWYRSESGLASSAALEQRHAQLRREVHACVGIVLRESNGGPRTRTVVEVRVPREVHDDPTRLPGVRADDMVIPPS